MSTLHAPSPSSTEPVLPQNPTSGGGFRAGAFETQGGQVSSRSPSAPGGEKAGHGGLGEEPRCSRCRRHRSLLRRALVGQRSPSLTLRVFGATLPFLQHPFFFISHSRAFSSVSVAEVLSLLLFLRGHQ